MAVVTKKDLVSGFSVSGVEKGDVVLVHSAMRTLGQVEGGGMAVAEALREVLGETGTLVSPTFCFSHEAQNPPIIDPENDKSEMGAISEGIRLLPGAKRSLAYRHSFAACGKEAEFLTSVDPGLSPFDMDSTFGRLLGLDAKIMLLGVTYHNATAYHFAEYLLQVKDRHVFDVKTMVKNPDGSLTETVMKDYQPKPNESGKYYAYVHDYNRVGLILEEQGLVTVTRVGNAICRVFRLRDLIHYFLDHYTTEFNLFAEVDGKPTVLPDGVVLKQDYLDGAGRPSEADWIVADPAEMYRVGGKLTGIHIKT